MKLTKSSVLHKNIMSHNSETSKATYSYKISAEAEKLILNYLFTEDRYRNFYRYANQHPDHLGTSSDKVRIAARNRKNYLRNEFIVNPSAVIRNLQEQGLSALAVKVESDIKGFVSFYANTKSTPVPSPIKVTPTKCTPTKYTPNKKAKVTFTESEDDSIHSDASGEQGLTKTNKSGMSTSSHRLLVLQEYDINLDEPEMTQGNMFPLYCKEVKGDGVSCDKLCLKLRNIDLLDYKNRLYSARLSDNFASVLVTLPRIPSYERNRDVVEQFHEQQAKIVAAKATKALQGGWSCDAAYTSHLKTVATYEGHDKELLTTVQYHFPKNMTCNNKYFNDGAGNDYKLIAKLVGLKRDPQFFASLIFEMVVDGSISNYGGKRSVAVSEADEILDLLAGMST